MSKHAVYIFLSHLAAFVLHTSNFNFVIMLLLGASAVVVGVIIWRMYQTRSDDLTIFISPLRSTELM